jgi:hypothetical protein
MHEDTIFPAYINEKRKFPLADETEQGSKTSKQISQFH